MEVDAIDVDGNTPLMVALDSMLSGVKGANKCAKALLSAGANVNAQNHHGRTPLHVVAKKGGTSHHQSTAILDRWCCVSIGSVRSAGVLVDMGADVNLCDIEGVTPLVLAISTGTPPTHYLCLDEFRGVECECALCVKRFKGIVRLPDAAKCPTVAVSTPRPRRSQRSLITWTIIHYNPSPLTLHNRSNRHIEGTHRPRGGCARL